MKKKLELVVDAKARLAEGPVWDDRTETLWWVDIENGTLHAHQPHRQTDPCWDIGCKVGVAVPREAAGMILGTSVGIELFDLETSQRTTVVAPERDRPDNRFNDGKCDPQGRFWVGTLSMVHKQNAGALYVLETDHSVRRVLTGVTTSNGLGWSPDQHIMYYIDTPTLMVRAFDFEGTDGSIRNERTAVQFPVGVGRPDGMTVDAEGMLWVAHWDGGRITRWNPARGQLLETITLPADRVTSCTFGGPDLRTLFVTTARHGLSDEQLAQQPHAGGLFATELAVGGLPANRFGG